jgi:glycosyltransferase involved in cell wall biosynthesis
VTHKKPLTLSIVIPAYNEESYLKTCLDSIAEQSVKPDQVIVVDNNSTDTTVDIAKSHPFVTLLHEKHQGVTFARNTGFNAVKSDIIGRIDADSILPANWVESVLNIFNKQPDTAGLSGPAGFYDLPFPRFTFWGTQLIRWTMFWAVPQGKRYLFGSNMAIRRLAWEAVASEACTSGGIHEDTDLSLHMEKAGYRIIFTQQVRAMIACRRADVSLRDAYHYAFLQKYTFKKHGIRFYGFMTGVVLLSVYPGLHFQRRTFNPVTRRFSWRYFRSTRHRPRPMPID